MNPAATVVCVPVAWKRTVAWLLAELPMTIAPQHEGRCAAPVTLAIGSTMRHATANALLLACAAIWGFTFIVQKSAMDHIGPLLFVAARSAVAALAVAPLVWREHMADTRPLAPGHIRMTALAGIAFLLAAVLQQQGIVTASVTNAGFLTALYVLFTPVIGWALTRRSPPRIVWFAMPLSILGAWYLGGGVTSPGDAAPQALHWGDALVIASAVLWAAHIVILSLAAPYGRPVLLTAGQFVVVAVLSFAAALVWEPVTLQGLRDASKEILLMGVFSTAITFTVFTLALRHTSPAEAAIIVSAETLFAALGAFLVYGERLTVMGGLGAVLILASTLLVQVVPALTSRARNRS